MGSPRNIALRAAEILRCEVVDNEPAAIHRRTGEPIDGVITVNAPANRIFRSTLTHSVIATWAHGTPKGRAWEALRDDLRGGLEECHCGDCDESPKVSFKTDGSLWLLAGLNSAGESWLAESLDQNALRWGSAYVVEPRYVAAIAEGLKADGGEAVR